MRIRSLFFLPLLPFWSVVLAQESLTVTVFAGDHERIGTPVCFELPAGWGAYESDFALRANTEEQSHSVPTQRDGDELCFLLADTLRAGERRSYTLSTASGKADAGLQIERAQAETRIGWAGTQVLSYARAPASVPPGVDPIFSRSGFIHPLRTPGGAVITRIQPPDHYHHYGLWDPWTKTEFRGREIDFWNLAKGQATVLHVEEGETDVGPVFAGLTNERVYRVFADTTRQDHEDVLSDLQKLRLYPGDSPDRYLLDHTVTQTNTTLDPFVVKAYRYQGLGLRARADWDDETASLLTSEGYNKGDGNATRARWIKVEGPTEAGTSGVLFLSHPANFDSPQLIRIWPEGANGGKENVFLNFNPAQECDLPYRPGGSYRHHYRLVVYDGSLNSLTAERYWHDFAHPPRVVVGTPALSGKRVLVYTKNGKGYVHDNIPASIAALERLGEENGFTVAASEDPGLFTPAGLADFDVLIFSNTNNDVFDTPAQEAAFRDYVNGGGGFVGIHSASGSERGADWFAEILGGRFHRHARRQDFDVAVVDADHPATDFLPPTWHVRDDECYYLKRLNPASRVLLAADLTTVTDSIGKVDYPADTFGDLFPVSWCHPAGEGRSWYTSLGHRKEHYLDPLFLRHLLGGIEWAAGE